MISMLNFSKKNCFGRKSSSVLHCTTGDHLLHSLLFPYGHIQVIWWAWIHIFCYSDRTWIKTTIQYKLLNDHHILLMGLLWIWLTKGLAWGKRNKKEKNKIKPHYISSSYYNQMFIEYPFLQSSLNSKVSEHEKNWIKGFLYFQQPRSEECMQASCTKT